MRALYINKSIHQSIHQKNKSKNKRNVKIYTYRYN